MTDEKRKVLITEAYKEKKWMIGRIGEHHGEFPPKLVVKDDEGIDHVIYGYECYWGYHDSDKPPTDDELKEGKEQTETMKAAMGELIQVVGIDTAEKAMEKILSDAGFETIEVTINTKGEFVEMSNERNNAFNLTNNSVVLWSNNKFSSNDEQIIKNIKTFLEINTKDYKMIQGTAKETNTTNTSDFTIIVRDIDWNKNSDGLINALFELIFTLSDDIYVAHQLRGF